MLAKKLASARWDSRPLGVSGRAAMAFADATMMGDRDQAILSLSTFKGREARP